MEQDEGRHSRKRVAALGVFSDGGSGPTVGRKPVALEARVRLPSTARVTVLVRLYVASPKRNGCCCDEETRCLF